MQQTIETPTATREEILNALARFIGKRTGLDARDYCSDWRDKEGIKAFRAEYRAILMDGKDARTLLRMVDLRPSITADDLVSAMDHGGRLTFDFDRKEFEYCAGQYWPTEYRPAAIRYLIRVLLKYFEGTTWQEKRTKLCKELRSWPGGRRIQRNYLS